MQQERETTIKDDLSVLFAEVKKYIELKYDFARLDFIEKAIIIVTLFITSLSLIILLLGVFLFLSIAFGYFLGELFGKIYFGFLTVAGIYFILFAIIFIFRNTLIYHPVTKIMLKAIFHKKKSKNTDSKDEN